MTVAKHVHKAVRSIAVFGVEVLHPHQARFLLGHCREHESELGLPIERHIGLSRREYRGARKGGVRARAHHAVALDSRRCGGCPLLFGDRGQVVERRHEHQCSLRSPGDDSNRIGAIRHPNALEPDGSHPIGHKGCAFVLLTRRRHDAPDAT